MRKSRFTESEIIYAVKQLENGISVAELARKYGVSQKTIYGWRKKYDGLSPSELKRLKDLEQENKQLKKLVADLSSSFPNDSVGNPLDGHLFEAKPLHCKHITKPAFTEV